MLTLTIAASLFMTDIPPCATEDSHNCVFYTDEQNPGGNSFIAIGGPNDSDTRIIYLPPQRKFALFLTISDPTAPHIFAIDGNMTLAQCETLKSNMEALFGDGEPVSLECEIDHAPDTWD